MLVFVTRDNLCQNSTTSHNDFSSRRNDPSRGSEHSLHHSSGKFSSGFDDRGKLVVPAVLFEQCLLPLLFDFFSLHGSFCDLFDGVAHAEEHPPTSFRGNHERLATLATFVLSEVFKRLQITLVRGAGSPVELDRSAASTSWIISQDHGKFRDFDHIGKDNLLLHVGKRGLSRKEDGVCDTNAKSCTGSKVWYLVLLEKEKILKIRDAYHSSPYAIAGRCLVVTLMSFGKEVKEYFRS